MTFRLSSDSSALVRRAGSYRAAGARARPSLRRAMTRAVSVQERDLKAVSLTGAKGSHSFWGTTGARASNLGVRSGFLRGSVTSRVFEAGEELVGVVGTPVRYARAHERGATITGRPFLKIPTRWGQTRAGVSRGRLAGEFVLRSRAGRLWVAARIGRRLELRHLLHRGTVVLRARGMFAASARRARGAVRAIFAAAGRDVVTGRA